MRSSKRLGHSWLLLLFIFVATSISCASNLLKNGDLEEEDTSEFMSIYGHTFKWSVFVEDDGNRCAKFEVVALELIGDSKCLNGSLLVGGVKGYYGENGKDALRLKPNTTYEFGFDVKGTITHINPISIIVWSEDGTQKTIKSNITEKIPLTQGWVRHEGEVTTDSTTYTAALKLNAFTMEPKDNPIHKPGDYMLADNFIIREKKEFPVTPTGFTTIRNNGSNKVELSWDAAKDAEEYIIYRDSEFLVRLDSAVTQWNDESAAANTGYNYSISAANYKGESPRSDDVYIERMGVVKGTVKGRRAGELGIIAGAAINVLDTGLNEVTSDENGLFKSGPLVLGEYTLEISAPSYQKQPFPFAVSSTDPYELDLGDLILDWDDVPPNPPTIIAADAAKHVGIIVLEWEPPIVEPEDVKEYNIYRSKAENIDRNVAPLTTVSAEALTFYDNFTSQDFGCTFYYQIEAMDSAGNKSEEGSNIVFAKVIAPPVPEPLEPEKAALVVEYPLAFSWQPVEDKDFIGYSIQISSSPDFLQDTQTFQSGTAANFSLASPLPQGTWYWRVNAIYDRDIQSAWSEAVEFITIVTEDNPYQVPYIKIEPQILNQGKVDISYYLTCDASILLRIFNLKGQLVTTLDSGHKVPGLYNISWDGRDTYGKELENGLVFLHLSIHAPGVGKSTLTKKVLINR